MKEIIELLGYEDKKAQNGKDYTRVKTEKGWISCFDKKVSELIKANIGNSVSCDVETNGNYRNIKIFYEPVGKVKITEETVGPVKIPNRDATMWASYTKDLVIAILDKEELTEEVVNACIKAIKQIKKEFE